jgi:thiamine biosynthesis protein ThiI
VIDEASELPVLRPLIGFDKMESEALAKSIGTYERSIRRVGGGCQPKKGCWARPPKPVTRARLETVREIEQRIGIDTLLEQSIATLREITELVFE